MNPGGRREAKPSALISLARLRDSLSDSDSGICVDGESGAQISPRFFAGRANDTSAPSKNRSPPSYVESRRLAAATPTSRDQRPSPPPLPPKPRKPLTALPPLSGSHSKKALKVRFALDCDDAACIAPTGRAPHGAVARPHEPPPYYYYSLNGEAGGAGPPAYVAACARMRTLPRRSASATRNGFDLPPMNDRGGGVSGSKSVENLAAATGAMRVTRAHPCVMPSSSCNQIELLASDTLPTRSRPHLPSLPSTSVPMQLKPIRRGSAEKSSKKDRPVQPLPSFYTQDRSLAPQSSRQIKTRLIGLDSQGSQIIELEKVDDGPFGFYIATGLYKSRKGIYVSRVTLTCLVSLLSVGDEILEVNRESVRGKTLEQVQTMIGALSKVLLRVRPIQNTTGR